LDWLRVRVRARRALRRAGIAQITQFVWDRGQVGLRENPRGMLAVVRAGFAMTALAWGVDFLLSLWFGWEPISSLLLFQGLWISGIFGMLLLNISFLTTLEGKPCERLGVANAVSLIRVGLLPTLSSAILRSDWTIALVLYLVLALSDVADGILARRRGEETRLGFILDPIADVIFQVVVFSSLFARDRITGWTLAAVLTRYGLLWFGSIALLLIRGRIWIKPTPFGRTTGVFLGAFTVYLLLEPIVLWGRSTFEAAEAAIAILFAAGAIHVLVIGIINFRRPAQAGYGDWRSWGLPLIRPTAGKGNEADTAKRGGDE
jgi:cardiolipin synthase